MLEFILLSTVELVLIGFVYYTIVGPRGFRNTSLLRQNPNLKRCVQMRRFVTPSVFLINIAAASVTVDGMPLFDMLILNGTILVISLMIGTMVSEVWVHKLKTIDWPRT